MQKEKCSHLWEMINLSNGLIVMKKCFHCAKVSTCFTSHNKSPLEPSHEGEHFWNFMESDPSFHFDLKCSKCGTLVKLDELVGLMICTECNETCEVGIIRRKLEPENVRVCIALGHHPVDERKQLPQEKFPVLEEYFNQQGKSIQSKIKLISGEKVKSIGKCYANVIESAETVFTTSSEKK